MRLTHEEQLEALTAHLNNLFVVHNIPKLYVPATPRRRVITLLMELHCHADYNTKLLGMKSHYERMLSVFDHRNPQDAKYFTMRDQLIDELQKDFLARTRRRDREEGEIRVLDQDRMVPRESIIPSFAERILTQLKGLVKK